MRTRIKVALWLVASAACLATASPVTAKELRNSDQWEFGGELYLWGAGIKGETTTGDDIDISFTDIIDNLDMGFMGTLTASKNRWSLIADAVYTNFTLDTKGTANIIGYPIKTKVEVEKKGFTTTLAAGYSIFETDTTTLQLLAGARYLYIEIDLNFDIGGSREKYSDSGSVWDGIIGARVKTDLTDKWYLTGYLDAGTGDTDKTWQASAGIYYRFKKLDAGIGYRHLEWDFDDDDTFDELNFSGPYAGAKFRF
jgi:hypothetical protein